MQPPRPHGRLARFFFMHLGGLVAIVVYFTLCDLVGYSAAGVTRALWIALAVHGGYGLLARWQGELKQFDVALALFLAIGAAGAAVGIGPVLILYQRYSPGLLFLTFTLAALLPLALGREPFTVYYGLRQAPRWQHRLPSFGQLTRVMAAFWGLLFVLCAALCVVRPTDPVFTALLPNLLIFGVGLTAGWWLTPLYFKFFPAPLPDRAEPLIMGMPLAFNRAAAGDARAVIQFQVSGAEPGNYWVRVARGRCETFEGHAPQADLTVHTPDQVWVDITHGKIDGAQALVERRYTAEGDLALLAKFGEWFR